MKKMIKSRFFVFCVLVITIISFGFVFADDVVIQEGTISTDNDVSGDTGIFNRIEIREIGTVEDAGIQIGGVAMAITNDYSGIYAPLMVTSEEDNLSAYGFKSGVAVMGTGEYQEAIGICGNAFAALSSGGACQDVTGGKFKAAFAGAEHPDNCFGVYIDDVYGGSNSNWALYDNTYADSCIHKLRVGSETSPTAELDVTGSAKVSDDLEVSGTVTMDTLVLPVKETTGDPSSPVEGQIYVNTADNKVRVYADGAWRDLATW